MLNNKKIDLTMKTRLIIVFSLLGVRLMRICYDVTVLLFQLMLLIIMIISQKHYDAWIELTKKEVDDEC